MKYTVEQVLYYTGDAANASGWFSITKAEQTPYGKAYDLKEIDGSRVFRGVYETGISDVYVRNTGTRFFTKEAYDAFHGKADYKPDTVNVKYYQNAGKFEPLELAEEMNIEAVQVEDQYSYDLNLLNELYAKYNRDDRPDGKIRRSMSVGDIVSIDGRAYVCQSWSWTRL